MRSQEPRLIKLDKQKLSKLNNSLKALSIVVACHLTAATINCDVCNLFDLPAYAKKSKPSSSKKTISKKTSKKTSRESAKNSRKKNSSISFQKSSSRSKREKHDKHSKHDKHEKRHGKPEKHHEVHHKAPPPEPQAIEPTLSDQEKQELAQRQSNYSTQSSAYALMDQGDRKSVV